MDFINEELYFEAFNLANELTKEVAYYCSKKVEEVKCFDIEKYVNEVEDIEFIDYSFKKQLKNKMLGSTSKVYGEVIITTNKNLMLERKNFTKMHEIIHFYRDIPYVSESHTFSDMVIENGYFPEDIPREYRANVGASILLANDRALLVALKKFSSFYQVADYFFMSKSALQNRLKEHLIFICNCTPKHAFQLVYNYRIGNNKEFFQVIYSKYNMET
ncbi:toxin [Enterococcus plantarum]|uniref:Toxin n=1 Tax=Enterococcus plantarum TaxID=1077675 RepID=A0A2W3Z6X2_9ENTE|nr:ImmA/IrrE family metallo-endopeptidase [Enterococcus plantarum]PZL72167.1 toxin [Enterococcus plantarum]